MPASSRSYTRHFGLRGPTLQITCFTPGDRSSRWEPLQFTIVHFICRLYRFLPVGLTVLLRIGRAVVLNSLMIGLALAAPEKHPPEAFDVQVTVDGQKIAPSAGSLQIPADTKDIGLAIQATSNASPRSTSFRYHLEGVDPGFQSLNADVGMVARFLTKTGDAVRHEQFFVNGESPGWKGTLGDSQPVRRLVSLKVPKDAARLTLLLSSAGGPQAVGTYEAENIAVFRRLPDGAQIQLFPAPGAPSVRLTPDGEKPIDWMRDGVRQSMAKVVPFNTLEHSALGLSVLDDDPTAHAEWRLTPDAELPVTLGETLTLQWDETYFVGTITDVFTNYACPPPGNYRLIVRSMLPTGAIAMEKILPITVYRPYWMQPLFWCLVGLGVLAAFAMIVRAVIRVRWRAYQRRMDQEHAVERERLRIARDLHDDLGARLTHISFFSQRAVGKGVSLEESQEKLKSISEITKNLVTSLYETVWSVDPKNDNLDALISYLTQIVDHLCGPVDIQCRIKVPDVIPDCAVASDVRHNISLAAKEVINNTIKHSDASMLTIAFEIAKGTFAIVISDNGRGFDPATAAKGNGLKNLKQRMTNGTVAIESAPGCGTTIRLEMPLHIKP